MWRTHDAMGWWMLFSAGLWIMFWAFIVSGLSSLLGPRDRARSGRGDGDPDRIAARRYANGDISREEYEELRHHLNQPEPAGP